MRAIKTASMIALATIILLSACSAPPASPTLDANAVYTQAASTVQAQLTQTALALPTATATVQPTETQSAPAAADTKEPTVEITVITLTPGDQSGGIIVPSLTPVLGLAPTAGSGGQKAGDNATFAYNVPADGKTFAKGEKFLLELGLTNSGSTTWNTQYKMVFMGGQYLCYQSTVNLDKNKAPGEKGAFDFSCYAPDKAGKYKSTWKLRNSSGLYVPGGEIYFSYTVQ